MEIIREISFLIKGSGQIATQYSSPIFSYEGCYGQIINVGIEEILAVAVLITIIGLIMTSVIRANQNKGDERH